MPNCLGSILTPKTDPYLNYRPTFLALCFPGPRDEDNGESLVIAEPFIAVGICDDLIVFTQQLRRHQNSLYFFRDGLSPLGEDDEGRGDPMERLGSRRAHCPGSSP